HGQKRRRAASPTVHFPALPGTALRFACPWLFPRATLRAALALALNALRTCLWPLRRTDPWCWHAIIIPGLVEWGACPEARILHERRAGSGWQTISARLYL